MKGCAQANAIKDQAREAFLIALPEPSEITWYGIASWFYHDLCTKIQQNKFLVEQSSE